MYFENIVQKFGFQNFHRKNKKCRKSKMFDENEIWSKNRKFDFQNVHRKNPNVGFSKFPTFFIFPMKILKTEIF